MSDLVFETARIDSSLQEPVDQWECSVVGATEYQSVDPNRVVSLAIGFLDGAGTPQVIQAITDGPIDEYRLEVQKAGVTSHLKGWGPAKFLHREYAKLYARAPEKPTQSGTITTPKVVGIFRASQVAAEVVDFAGVAAGVALTCAWQCRDYELWEDFDATGRCLDILQRLIDPWCSVEPSRVDILVDGTTVYLRSRRAFPPTADYVLTIDATAPPPRLKVTSPINIRKRRLPLYADLTLTGREEAGATPNAFTPLTISGVFSQNIEIVPFERTVDPEGGVTFTPGTMEQRQGTVSNDPLTGTRQTRVEIRSTYQIPNQVLLRTVKEEYITTNGKERLAKRETKTFTYQEFTYDAKGPTNSPMCIEELGQTETWQVKTDSAGTEYEVFTLLTQDRTDYTYDEDNYLSAVTTLKKKNRTREGVNELVPDSYIVKVYQDTGPLTYQIQSSVYGYQEARDSQGIIVGQFVPIYKSGDVTPASGHRPGGPNRPPTKPLGADTAGVITAPLRAAIHLAADGDPASAGSPHMSAEDLAYIRAQHEEASGLYECVIEFEALAMPWLRPGTIAQIEGIVDRDEDGTVLTTITTGNALVYARILDHDIPARRSLAMLRAVWYEHPA
ncbi:MAG TPA: hypothetical protein VKN16_21385 [Methylomirabilota bacterium]|nr:hypothetical protein [Methylomirabilota bacterium]